MIVVVLGVGVRNLNHLPRMLVNDCGGVKVDRLTANTHHCGCVEDMEVGFKDG